jgi:hypothetical protein
MVALISLCLNLVASLFKPKNRLEVENAALRHQLLVGLLVKVLWTFQRLIEPIFFENAAIALGQTLGIQFWNEVLGVRSNAR